MIDLILILMGGAGSGGWYAWTGYVHRTKPCKHCGGWGYKTRRGLLSSSAAPCGKCGTTGKVLRPAARRVQRKRLRSATRTARRVVSTR